ncbi:MAG: uL15 family ribosomal protein [Clostridia bacterium]|nr:uL15 family ribosomal protein [Clostridia bacterium]
MKKTMRSVFISVLAVAMLLSVFMVGASAAVSGAGYDYSAGDGIVYITSSYDAFSNSTLVTSDVSRVYSGFTLDDSYRKVLLAYKVELVHNDNFVSDTTGETFNVKIVIPSALRDTNDLGLYHVNSSDSFEKVDAFFSEGYVEFTTEELGVFAFAVRATAPVPYVEPDYSWVGTLIWIGVAVLLIGGVVLFIVLRRRKAVAAAAAEETCEQTNTEAPAPEAETPAQTVAEATPEAAPETPVEETAAEELPAEPEKPAITIRFTEESEAVGEDGVAAPSVRFRTSFESRYIQSGVLQDYYTAIKNALLSYKGVKARTSWNYEAFNKARVQCAKVNIKGNALLVYLPLDPANYNIKKYHFNDMSAKPKFAGMPMLMKVKSERALKYTLELIEEVMKALEIPMAEVQNVDYHMPYETTEELASRGLVKIILPAGVTLEDNISVVKTNVGAMLANEAAAEAKTIVASEAVRVVSGDIPHVIDKEKIVHVDAVKADEMLTNDEAKQVVDVIHTGAAERKGRMVAVNLDTLCESYEDGETVDVASLKAKSIVPASTACIKVLARGTMTKALTVIASKYSLAAVKMIYLAGGHAEIED